MYYVKLQNGDQIIKVEITDENVFTDCPICGDEKQVDIKEELKTYDSDLFGTTTYCKECYELMKDDSEHDAS